MPEETLGWLIKLPKNDDTKDRVMALATRARLSVREFLAKVCDLLEGRDTGGYVLFPDAPNLTVTVGEPGDLSEIAKLREEVKSLHEEIIENHIAAQYGVVTISARSLMAATPEELDRMDAYDRAKAKKIWDERPDLDYCKLIDMLKIDGYTQSAIAKRWGCSSSDISRLYSNERKSPIKADKVHGTRTAPKPDARKTRKPEKTK